MRFFRVPYLIQSLFWNRKWTGRDPSSVYLTFDDGPDETVTPWLLEFLNKENIQATFFCIGSQVEKYPAIYKKMKQFGHMVGNHTYNHEKGSRTDNEEYLKSIKKTDDLMNTILFRPPYGRLTREQERQVTRMGKKTVMWTWNAHDYDHTIDEETIVKKAALIKGGDILLFHNSKKSAKLMMACLPKVIGIIKEKNLIFKTVA